MYTWSLVCCLLASALEMLILEATRAIINHLLMNSTQLLEEQEVVNFNIFQNHHILVTRNLRVGWIGLSFVTTCLYNFFFFTITRTKHDRQQQLFPKGADRLSECNLNVQPEWSWSSNTRKFRLVPFTSVVQVVTIIWKFQFIDHNTMIWIWVFHRIAVSI